MHVCVLMCFMYVVLYVKSTHFWNTVINRRMGKNYVS